MKNRKIIFVGVWFLVNGIISVVVAWVVSEIYDTTYLNAILVVFIKVNFISGFASLTGYKFGKKYSSKSYALVYAIVVVTSLAGAMTGMFAGSLLIQGLLSDEMAALDKKTIKFTAASLPVLTVVISIIAASIDILMTQKKKYKNQIELLSEKNRKSSLVFKEKGSLIKINPPEVVYLSSAAQKTIIHTTKEDYELGALMKVVEAQLVDKNFIRIHKQFIINTDFIVRFYHIKSGLYEVSLNDDDETVLPVGRKYAANIKNFLYRQQAANH
jgi:hypothetical protein